MWFTAKWPDGIEKSYYSPSLVVHDHLELGAAYLVEEFVTRTDVAMNEASERVRAKFGFACTSAMETMQRIHNDSTDMAPTARVIVTAMSEPKPA